MDRRTFLKIAGMFSVPVSTFDVYAPPTSLDDEQEFRSENIVPETERVLLHIEFAQDSHAINVIDVCASGQVYKFWLGAQLVAWVIKPDMFIHFRGRLRVLATSPGLFRAVIREADGKLIDIVAPFEVQS